MKKKVEVTINNQPFTFIGEDEEKIRKVAAFVDDKIKEVIDSHRMVNTVNAIVMAMMVVADEYMDMKDKAKNFEGKALRLLKKVENFEVPCGVRDNW